MITNGAEPGPAVDFWEDRYRERPQIWSGRVNAVMAAEVADLGPGTALDLGCGEGGDAIWLAEHGWTVTASDISDVALQRATARAAEVGLADRIDWQRHDFSRSFPEGAFDLVSAQFLQSPVELPRAEVLQRAVAAVGPGGSLLIVSHAAFPPWSRHADHEGNHDFLTPEEELGLLELDLVAWEVVRCEVAEREATGPDGQLATLYDSVVRVRRLPT